MLAKLVLVSGLTLRSVIRPPRPAPQPAARQEAVRPGRGSALATFCIKASFDHLLCQRLSHFLLVLRPEGLLLVPAICSALLVVATTIRLMVNRLNRAA
jgi:hypothetical protein